jgi:regulator of sirC expression with transglutaminase-like and TPR domain
MAPRSEFDLFAAAMKIARIEYPDLNISSYRSRLEEFGRRGSQELSAGGARTVDQFNRYFFEELGFHGNAEDYYDPRNSYLNDVIDRRIGIPITLSTVYCEVARRAGLRAFGVGFPGHFLVKCLTPAGETLIDCFNTRIVSRQDCQQLLQSMGQDVQQVSDDMLEIASPPEIISRMLNNLRRIHAGRGDFARAVRWIEMDMEIHPDSPHLFRERGMLRVQMQEFGKAMADLERYESSSAGSPDLAQVREQIRLIRKLLSQLN